MIAVLLVVAAFSLAVVVLGFASLIAPRPEARTESRLVIRERERQLALSSR